MTRVCKGAEGLVMQGGDKRTFSGSEFRGVFENLPEKGRQYLRE